MAKSKSKSAKSGGLKDLLLKKGEWIALGGAGVCLCLLLFWGVRQGAKAEDPNDVSKKMVEKASNIQRLIKQGELKDGDLPEVPAWIKGGGDYKRVPVQEFAVAGPLFDITARPDTKRDNPLVLGIEEYQIDLVKAPMKAYDIRQTATGSSIAVRTVKLISPLDAQKVKDAKEALIRRQQRGRGAVAGAAVGGVPLAGGAQQPPPGGIQPPAGGIPSGPPGSGGGMTSGGAFGFGSASGGSGGFDTNAARSETVIEYVPLETLDTVIATGKIPAATVVPLRMVVVHATIPLKKQIEEIKRALRLPTALAAADWGPIYDGYEIQRKETGPRGIIVDWPTGEAATKSNYDFESSYIDLIASRKLADHFDVVAGTESEFLPYFLRYEQALALPLPELVTELGAYPELRLPLIKETIKNLIASRRPPITQSDIFKRLNGKGAREGLYTPTTSSGATGVGAGEGLQAPQGSFGGPRGATGGAPTGVLPGPLGAGGPPGTSGGGRGVGIPPLSGGAGGAATQPVEVESLLLRFIDCDVKPGHTYEYRIQLKMKNPNTGQKGLVLNPVFADEKYATLRSPWVTISTPITVPQENFLFAFDPATYKKTVEETYKGPTMRSLLSRFQARDNQAVVQVQQWRQEVRTGDNKREPIGAWIVTEMPVGRGEYIGRKQYVKLPLWSSEANNYVLREIPDKVFKGPNAEQPKGWLVDFSDQSVLVDFEGGKVKALFGNRTVEDDVGEELLILGRDGKLLVRNSIADEGDPNRKAYTGIWDRWLKSAEARKTPTTGTAGGGSGEFDRPKN